MIDVPTPPMFAYYSGAFGTGGQPYSRLLRETAIIEFKIITFMCFIRAAKFGVTDLFLPSRYRALRDEGRLCANEGVLIPLSRETKAKTMDRGLLTIINDCEVDPVATLLAFARADEIDWSDSEAVDWFLYDFASAMVIAIPEWNRDGCKWGRGGDPLPGAVHPKVAPKYVEKYRDSGMKRGFTEAVWNRFKTKGVNLKEITSIEEQGAFVRDVTSRSGKADVEAVDVEDDWDFQGMVSADEVVTSGVRGKLKDIQRICKDGEEAVPTSLLEVVDLSREVVETKRDNAKLLDRTNDLIVELDESKASERLACDRVRKAEARVKTLEEHVEASDSKYSKTVEEAARAEGKLRSRITSLLEELEVEKDCIARFEEFRTNENTENREIVASRQKAIVALKDQLRDKESTLEQVRAELPVATIKLGALRLRVERAEEEMKMARADVSLQTSLREDVREQLDAKVAELEEVQSQLEMREDELVAAHDAQAEVASELEQLRARIAKRAPGSGGAHSTVEDDERSAKRAKGGRSSENNMGAPSTAAYSALLAEHDEFKSRCEALVLENQCIPGLAEKAKELRTKVADVEKSNTSAKSIATRERSKKRPTVAEKQVIALEAELKEAQDAQKRSVEKAKKFAKRATDVASQLAVSVQRLTEVEESAKLATEKHAAIELQAARSSETAEDASRRLTKLSRRAELLEEEALGLKSQRGEMTMASDSAIAEATDKKRQGKAQEARVRMLGDELDSLKRREPTHCDLEVMTRKVADAQGDIIYMVTGLHRETVNSYDSTLRGVDGAFVDVSRHLKEVFDCEARNLQQRVLEAVRRAAEGTRKSFINAPIAIDKRLGLIVGRATGTDGSAKPDASSSRTAVRGAQTGASRNHSSSGRVSRKSTPPSAKLNSPGAHNTRDHSGYGA